MFPIVFIIIIWLDIYKWEQVLGMTPYKCNLQQHFFVSGSPFPFQISEEGNTVYVVKYFYHFCILFYILWHIFFVHFFPDVRLVLV